MITNLGKETRHLLFSRVWVSVCSILNQIDQCSKFEAKAYEGVFLGYSSISKALSVFNLSRQTVEETAHATFDEDSFIHDWIDHPSYILNELTHSPLYSIPKFLPNDTEVFAPNVD
uniref:Retroviral polymerase SH3-like domain-containing protein n=1 Tax=Lactuca sativa TaxID=4236 RepID=A0A9R1W8T4_LACSA|nr:hypothetical protein LSAT_V11C300132070 [Lactuca sativa]